MVGFTFVYGSRDVFIETNRQRKNNALASEILSKMELPDTPANRAELLRRLQKAKCEIRQLSNGRQYYEISGENFGGKGSFIDDDNTIIIKL